MKKIIASSAVVAGLLFSAQASTAATYTFDANVKYIDTIYYGVDIYYKNGEYLYFDTLSKSDDMWSIPVASNALQENQVYNLQIETNPERYFTCSIGPMNCSVWIDWQYLAKVELDPIMAQSETDQVSFNGPVATGTTISVLKMGYGPDAFWDNFGEYIGGRADYLITVRSRYTIFEVTSIPAVPLPASAIFLPTALGALFVFRRRNKV